MKQYGLFCSLLIVRPERATRVSTIAGKTKRRTL